MKSDENTKSETQKDGKKEKKYINPLIGYGVFGGTLVLAVAIALIVLLPML